MTLKDQEMTLSDLAAAIGCSKNTAANWPRAGMPVLKRGGRGRGNATTVSLRAACRWLLEREVAVFQTNDFSLIASLEIKQRAAHILRQLKIRT
jgi:phage terminase Nu1 subunit (DNA packaging protein)